MNALDELDDLDELDTIDGDDDLDERDGFDEEEEDEDDEDDDDLDDDDNFDGDGYFGGDDDDGFDGNGFADDGLFDDDGLDVSMMDVWERPETTHRKCQYCKQPRDCRQGPDPYLFYFHREIEEVWLCDECFGLREEGKHLPENQDEE